MLINEDLIGRKGREPIAIIGIGCRFPGGAKDPASFWDLLSKGVDAITEIPEDRWNTEEHYYPFPGRPGKSYSRWGGFIEGIDQFEPEFFGISPREAAHMDPQQRLILELAWEALEDGGTVPERLAGTNTGVFLGISHADYAHMQSGGNGKESVQAHSATGSSLCIAANRISYCLNLRGPSIAVDTACSSSLVATHLACRSIWSGECSLALAGGVNIIISSRLFVAFSAASMLSPDGRCKAFDAGANGFVRGEGAGVVVLKPLSKALADGDSIYALIVGSAVNQDGRTSGIAMPSQEAQQALLREVCREASVEPNEVDYVEAHGTGTEVGDPIEASAIGSVLFSGRSKGSFLTIGSVKTNIGHLEAAAGVAGVVKVALCLKHRMIPPSLHFSNPNPTIPFEDLQLRVPTSLEPWPDGSKPAIAGVNSFGFGGTNAHVLMMEYRRPAEDSLNDDPSRAILIPLSARTPQALQGLARAYRDFLADDSHSSGASLGDIGYTLGARRSHFDHCLALVARDRTNLRDLLEAFVAGEKKPGMVSGRRVHGQAQKVAFVCSGQGPQWWGMGRELMASEAVFREKLLECSELVGKHAGWSLLEELNADETRSRLDETAIAQPAIFSFQVALAALWKSWGIQPEAVVGHSLGEVAAAYLAGALSLRDAARLIVHRGRCMDFPGATGKMLAVAQSAEEAEQLISGYEDRVSVAAINSHCSVTLSGEAGVLDEISEALSQKGIFCRFLRVRYAFHSPQMEPVKREFLQCLDGVDFRAPDLALVSTVTGGPVVGRQCDPDYWWTNIRQTVRFAPAMHWLIERDFNVFLELSPHPVLASSISECLLQKGQKGAVLPSLRRGEGERDFMLASLGTLYTLGHPVDWEKLYAGRRVVDLPKYPWERQRCWNESEASMESRLGRAGHPLLGRRLKSADPIWENPIDKRLLAYLGDHRVRGTAVFPAAAYLEMALAACREMFGDGAYILDEIQFQRALFLPDGGAVPTVQLVFYPSDSSFAIYSRGSDSDQEWALHAIGSLRKEERRGSKQRADVKTLMDRLPDEISGEDCYGRFADTGLQFGSLFRGVERIWRRDGEAAGKIRLHESLKLESKNYCMHPAFLDSCFQVSSGAMPRNRADMFGSLYIPVQIRQIRFHAPPDERAWSHALLKKADGRAFDADIHVYNEDGTVLMEIEGFKCQAVGPRRDGSEDSEKWFYHLQWRDKPLPGNQSRSPTEHFPGSRQIAEFSQAKVSRLIEDLGWSGIFERASDPLEKLAAAYIAKALRELGCEFGSAERLRVDSLTDRGKVMPRYQRLLERLLRTLARRGYLQSADREEYALAQMLPEEEPEAIWRATLAQFPAFIAELNLLIRCGSKLAAVLRGEVKPLEIIFPQGSMTLAEQFYQDSPSFRFYNLAVQKIVSQALCRLPEGQTARILEVGAGTGGMTAYVLCALVGKRIDYVFSDKSNLFFAHAEQKFRDYPFVRFQSLDIESDPVSQGYEPHSFDLILASNVLHATRDLRRALGNVRQLLAPRGMAVILEAEEVTAWADLVFGLTEGWWNFQDFDLRPDYPLIPKDKWTGLLGSCGFGDVEAVSLSSLGQESGQVILLAREPSAQKDMKEAGQNEKVKAGDGGGGAWLVFADRGGAAERLDGFLAASGEACVQVVPGEGFRHLEENRFQISPHSPEDMKQLVQTVTESYGSRLRGVIHLWSLDTPASRDLSLESLALAEVLGCHAVMHFIQAWDKAEKPRQPPLLVLVTRGAQPIATTGESLSIGQAPIVGLGRVIVGECSDVRVRLVDLDPDNPEDEIRSLFLELRAEDGEEEVALRHGARFVPRVERASWEKVPAHSNESGEGETKPFRLEIPAPGILDALALKETRRHAPGPGEVEIEVFAASLNFRDVMKALGLYPTDQEDSVILGDECSGRIAAVGDRVEDFKVGDEVVAVAPGSFGSYVTTSAAFVMHKPPQLTFEDAATLPVAFLTAYYALHYIGRVRAGERVLIHSASGGVGLAALQVARQIGAEIFATAGSPEKRELLEFLDVRHVLDSRSLSFADQILRITDGKGVDVVLNSLAGKAIAKGLSCLAPYGRFLELGKRDIYQNNKLGLWAFRKNLSFFAIDLGAVMMQKPSSIGSLFRELAGHFKDGTLRSLPYRVFPISRCADAFRYMAQARHAGKIVVSVKGDDATIEPLEEGGITFRPDATYLITGGLGGFGLTVGRWIVEHGGRNLVLVGRSGAVTEETGEVLGELRDLGAKVIVAKADVGRAGELAEVLAEIDRSMPPLKGIVHAAMVLDDGIILHLNREKFRKVMAPKVDGAWNLHCQTLNKQLDFFVLFSSASALVANQGQGNYVAANTFLDALAVYRRSLGLAATSINWGHLAEVGYVARHQRIAELLTRHGIEGFSPRQAMDALGRILRRRCTRIGMMRLDWQKLCGSLPKTGLAQRFSLLAQVVDGENPRREGADWIREALLAAKREQVPDIVLAYMREQVARVFGTSAAKLDVDQPLNEAGLDSLMAVELKARIESDLALSLPAGQLMPAPSVRSLAKAVVERLGSAERGLSAEKRVP